MNEKRLVSLDVFRGATIASMMLVNNPGSDQTYAPLEHAEWNGWTFTDLIFPFFLWIVGVAMTLSFARRAGIIFLIGLLLNGFPRYNLATIRIPGVLQRIAICYLVATVIYLYTGVRGQIVWTAALLAVYWVLMTLMPVPGYGPGVLAREGNFAKYIDGLVLTGHMWRPTRVWDPEGIVSTIPAIATVLFGTLAGHLLRLAKSAAEKTAWLFVAGNVLIFAGAVMDAWLPINKNLWTSSYSVFMAGMAANTFAICYWLVDVQGWRRWTQPFAIYGMNAIMVFILSGLIGRLAPRECIFSRFFEPLASPKNASLLYALANVLLLYAMAYFMYRRRWFVKF